MKNIYMRKLKFSLVFIAFLFISLSKVYAQPATKLPFIKYAINNYASISQAVCDTCPTIVGKPLQQFRPIPFPPAGLINLAPGVDITLIPGLSAPNFLGGGSPEIEGMVKEVAGMTDGYAEYVRKTDILYFRSGAQGVAVSKATGKIFTSSSTFLPGVKFDNPLGLVNGFFSFKSTAAILPTFNDRSEEAFTKSPDVLQFNGQSVTNENKEIAYFALNPNNENIVYAAFKNSANDTKVLARKNRNGDWEKLDLDIVVGLADSVWGALAVDMQGNLYVADSTHHIVVKITIDESTGTATSWTIIGGKMDTPGFVNADSIDARFNKPSGICIDIAGNIYIGDAGNNRIRKIDNNGQVTTFAGNGEKGFADDNNFNDAKFWGPTAVAYNENTKVLYVVDLKNKLVRAIDKDRHVTTLAGNAGSLDPRDGLARFTMAAYYQLAKLNMKPGEAKFDNPTGLAIDPSGFGLYVSDGQYIKYVNSSQTIFTITGAIGDPKANVLGQPVLPLGIRMNSNNGSFYGVPLLPWQPTTYTVSITNHVGTNLLVPFNGVITFEVVPCPEKTDTVIVNKTIFLKELPYTWNGKTLYSAGTAAVTNQTLTGCDSVTVLNLSISPELSYNTEPYILSFGLPIKPIVPTTAGSKIETFSVAPPLPAGLVLNAQTGVITGTPTVYVPGNPVPAVGTQTPPQYPGPWTLQAEKGADLTEFKISDGNGKVLFENNSAYGSLQGTAGTGTGTAGAYTDFSSLGATKLYSNSPYSIRLANSLKPQSGYILSLNESMPYYNFMNSYAVYIDYNRDGDFDDPGERAYISASPQRDAHTEVFNLNIPASASAGVTKMRIYAVEARTDKTSYIFFDPSLGLANQIYWIDRTTEQALSFYPFFKDISNYNGSGETDFHNNLDYGEFEDYNIDIVTPPTQGYVVTGSNTFGSAQSTVRLAVSKSTSSTTNLTICNYRLPYKWNNLIFTAAGTKTDTLKNMYAADSLATLNLTVNQQSPGTFLNVAYCGPYDFNGQVINTTGDYRADLTNVAGCDSMIYLNFRQKATGSVTNLTLLPNALTNYSWNGIPINTAGTYTKKFTNAENCDSIATLKLRVEYNIYYTNNLLNLGKPIVPISPRIEGNYVPPGVWYNSAYGYSIAPALPGGLSLDPFTGVINGTPTQLSPLQTYIITLGQDGALPSTFSLAVGIPSTSTTTVDNCGPFTWNGVVYESAGTATYFTKNQYGFDSTATLILSIRDKSTTIIPLNLNLSQLDYIWQGATITGEGPTTVHYLNAAGCDSAVTADVVISPKIFYVSPQILLYNQATATIAPQILGGKVMNYAISPSLVNGLQFNRTTGIITGTPTDTLLSPVTHAIVATNRAGTDTTKLVIAVCNTMATSFTMDVCDKFVWNDSIYTKSTSHTRTFKNRGGCDSVVTMNLIIRYSSKGATTNVTACSNYVWYDVNYDKTGIYTKVFPNAVGCDSTITLNLTVNYPSVNNLYVNLNASDLPYTWRGKTFTVPGTDSILLRNGNSVACDSTVRMTVRISALLPDISYAVTDTILYWEKRIETPIAMTNTGTPIPAMKLGESDTLIKFANAGPGDHIRNTVKGRDGAYYSRVQNNSTVFKLSPSGVWTPFANAGSSINGLAIDTSGNLYVAVNALPSYIKKITPDGNIGDLPGSPLFYSPDNVFVDGDNNLFILESHDYTQLDIVKINLSTGKQVKMTLDNSPYFQFGPEDMKVDSKGNIYVYRNYDNVVVKIRPDGRMSGIGQKGTSYSAAFKPGNGPDATLPTIYSMAIDPTNDNLYIMASGQLLRVDTAENVTAISGKSFDQWKDQIFRVDGGKVSVINNTKGRLFTSNVYGVGSLPFMDNYGVTSVNIYGATVNFTDFDKRIRLDSSGSIVGTPRATYSSAGYRYGSNNTTGYSIIAANQHGTSRAPMAIITKGITYKRESFVTTTLPFVWRGRSVAAATDTVTYYVKNSLEVDDTLYMLHLVYEGAPEPIITSNCAPGGVSLAANGAAKGAIRFDGTNRGVIKNVQPGGDGGLGYYNGNSYRKADGTWAFNFSSAFEVWIKPASVSGTQYLLTRDTVRTNNVFFGYSIQDGKFVYEFQKRNTLPLTDYKLSSVSNIDPNVWTHVAASYYDSTMYIFINGKLEGSLQTLDNTFGALYYEPGNSDVSIFPDLHLAGLGSQKGYKGEMDELRLWGSRRNADSVKATMNSIVNPSSYRLGLYYRFDGDISTGVMDISGSARRLRLTKPAASVANSGAPINFASYKWMPGGDTTKSIVVNPTSNTLYTVTATDYKKTTGSTSLLVYPASAPTVTAPAAVAKTNSPSFCNVLVSDSVLGIAIAVDNCPGVTVKRTGVPAGNLFPLGVTTITYTATNLAGLTKSASQTVTITDNIKPIFTTNLSANPVVIWPPDKKLKDIVLTYTTKDNCGTVKNNVTVTATDPITGVSSGNKPPDWMVINDHFVQLKADRANGKESRIYTITVTPVDGSGNIGTPQSVNVYIAHNFTPPVYTSTSASVVTGDAERLEVKEDVIAALTVKAMPNPSSGQFTLITKSNSVELLDIKVTDETGRLVERKTRLVANNTLYLGYKYLPGIYFVEVLQGKQKQILKLIKL